MGPPEYFVIEPVTPDYYYVPVYNPVVVYGAGFWPSAYVPFIWYPTWWVPGPVFGFGPVYVVGPALWCDFRWGHRGFDAIRINTVRYSQFNKVHIGGPGQFQNWKFDPGRRGNLAFKNPKLEQQFGKGKPGRIAPDKLITDKGVTGKPAGNQGKDNKVTTDTSLTGKPGANKGKDNKLTTDTGLTGKPGGNKGKDNKLTTDTGVTGKPGANKGKDNKLTTDTGLTGNQGGNKGKNNKITTEKLTTPKGPTGNQGGSNKITTEKFTTHKTVTGNQGGGNKGPSGPTFKPSSVGSGGGGKPPGGGGNIGGSKPSGAGGGGGGGGNRKDRKP